MNYEASAVNPGSYTTLKGYQCKGAGIQTPTPAGVPSMSLQVVPQYSAPAYNALQHGYKPSGRGYFNISQAYCSYPSGCTVFSTRQCA